MQTTINYIVKGEGSPVVWLHGFMEDLSIWEELTNAIPDKQHICIDLLGHGRTPSQANVHGMQLQTDIVDQVLRKLTITNFALVGHSMGGYIGLELLKKYPNECTHFVLLNSTSYEDSPIKKQNRVRALRIVDQQKDSYARMGIVNLFSPNYREQFSVEIERLIKVAQNTSCKGIKAALEGMKAREATTEILAHFQGKKLMISGKEDPIIPIENAREEAQKTNCQFVQVSGGHMSYLEDFHATTRILNGFLKEL